MEKVRKAYQQAHKGDDTAKFRDSADVVILTDDQQPLTEPYTILRAVVVKRAMALLKKRHGTRFLAVRLLGEACADPEQAEREMAKYTAQQQSQQERDAKRLYGDMTADLRSFFPEALPTSPTAYLSDRHLDVFGNLLLQGEKLDGAIHRFLFSGGTR